MGDEFGMHGGADPDNRRMLDHNLTSQQQELHDFTALLGNFRLENEALRRGTYSTYYADANLLAYEMISESQELLVVLNRGGSTTLDVEYDTVLIGQADLTGGVLGIPAFSVNIIGYGSTADDGQSIEEEGADDIVSEEGLEEVEGSDLMSSTALQNGLIILVFIMLALLIQTIRRV